MDIENLDKIFKPKSIAVIGASEKADSAGYRILRNLVSSGYKGVVYPVNPKYGSIQGVHAYQTVNDLPKVVDLAIVTIPSEVVTDIVEQCGKKGIKGIVIVSAGFKETGEGGKALEKKLKEIKENYDLRIIGPNCVGFIMPYLNLNATFIGSAPEKGNIALFSQSGAICSAILDWAAATKVGFSAFVSVGSMLDVDFGDLIDYFGADKNTRSILLYVESITNARKFMSAAQSFARVKPIVVIKTGRYEEGAKAVSSHTGALAGEDAIYDAAFKRAGIVRVKDIEDLFNCSAILDKQPQPTGPNLAIITNAGGPGVLATDSIIEKGGKIADLSKETMEKLDQILPEFWSKGNPIDIIGDADEERYQKVMEICYVDKSIDGLLILCVPQAMTDPRRLAEKIIDISRKSDKPILTSFIGEESLYHARQILNRNNVPTYSTPEEAVESYMHLYHYARNLALLFETPEKLSIKPPCFDNKDKLIEIVDMALKEDRTLLTEGESKEFLRYYGIESTTPFVARSEDEAVQLAEKVGYPVVMKVHSHQITHKSDIGGVILDLQCESEVRESFREMVKKAQKKVPEAKIEGVTIQKMIKTKGHELILGSKKDPVFGSVILFGMGGVYTEIFKDKAIGFPPLNQVLAQRIIEQTKAYEILQGFRGYSPIDMQKVDENIMKFSRLIIDHPEIKEIDINPLIASDDTLIAADARIIVDKHPEKTPHLILC
jgi:acetyltransferase